MGNFKFAPDLFLEVAELNRLKKFLRDDEVIRDFQSEYEQLGIVRNQYYDPNFNYFQAININVADTVYVNPGFAYDRDRNVLTSTGASLGVSLRNIYYWIKISYKINNLESGTITIGGSNGGLMTGLGTKFTELLRGQPNFPSKITFTNSVNYNQEYELLEIVDDETAFLQGSFPVAETGLKWQIVGTFTPGAYPKLADKYPFQYDDFSYALIPETGTNVMPSYEQGKEFFIARVLSTNLGVTIEDKRQFFIAETRSERLFSELPIKANPLIGIESIIKTAILTKIYYTVSVSWGMRITSESRNYTNNKTTINSGNGGIYTNTNAFTTGDFDGWRYYYQNGDWSRIISSLKNGSGIDLQLDILKSESIGVMICPNAEEIEINMFYFIAGIGGAGQLYKTIKQRFHTFTPDAVLIINQDEIDSNFLEVDVKFRFKTILNLTDWSDFKPSVYTIPGLTQVVSKNILLTTNPSVPMPSTAWRGINPFCLTDSLGTPIYYKILPENTVVIPTVYFPNSSFPDTSLDETTIDLRAFFYSDAALTIPLSVTHVNLRVIVKQTDTVQNTQYDTPNPGDVQVYNFVQESLLIYTISPSGVDNILLGTVDSVSKSYQHPTNVVGMRRITTDNEYTYFVFPSKLLIVGNTGQRGYTNLEQYFTATNLPTGTTKPNLISDPDYIPPFADSLNCSLNPDDIIVTYGYGLNIEKVDLTGSTTGLVSPPLVADTESGAYSYILPEFLTNEPVSVKVKIKTLDAGNHSGFIWVRVTWRNIGSTSVTYTNVQVANDIETTLITTFTNILNINISNY